MYSSEQREQLGRNYPHTIFIINNNFKFNNLFLPYKNSMNFNKNNINTLDIRDHIYYN